MRKNPHFLLAPEQTNRVTDGAPCVYLDNYFVRGLKAEREALDIPNTTLNFGIERVSQGVVAVDRPIDPAYLEYLEKIGLFNPDAVRLAQISGTAETMVARACEVPGTIDEIRKMIDETGALFIDTFGISEELTQSEQHGTHEKLALALGLPLYYHPGIAARLRNKSTYRKLVSGWLTSADPSIKNILHLPKGMNHLSFQRQGLAGNMAKFLQGCDSSKIVIKKDVATFNKGNVFVDKHAFLEACSNEHALQAFIQQSFADDGKSISEDESFCVEEFIVHGKDTPSSQMRVLPDGTPEIKTIQGQVYKDGKLLGFKYPYICPEDTDKKLHDILQFLGKKLANLGYQGYVVPDFVIEQDTGKIFLMELNMRRGGSSVGQNAAERLNEGSLEGVAYITSAVRFKTGVSLADIEAQLDDLAYNPRERNGIAMVEFGRFPQTGFGTLMAVRSSASDGEKQVISSVLSAGLKRIDSLLKT